MVNIQGKKDPQNLPKLHHHQTQGTDASFEFLEKRQFIQNSSNHHFVQGCVIHIPQVVQFPEQHGHSLLKLFLF